MSDERKLFIEASFYSENRRVQEGSTAAQVVVYAEVRGVTFPIAKFVPNGRLYQEGLERNHKPIVNMGGQGDHMSELLTAHAKIGQFTEAGYGHIIEAYRPFIDTRMQYEALVDRIRQAQSNGGWV